MNFGAKILHFFNIRKGNMLFYAFWGVLSTKNIRGHLERCPELAVERLYMNCSDQFIVKVREIARECKKLLIRERPDVAFGCIQQE